MSHVGRTPLTFRPHLLLAFTWLGLGVLGASSAQSEPPSMPTRIVVRTVRPDGTVSDLPVDNVRRGQTVIQERHIQATSRALRNASIDISLPPSTRFVGLLPLPENITVLCTIDHVTFSAVPLEPDSTPEVPASPAEYVAVRLKIALMRPGNVLDARILINVY